ncbi:hypothetical protein Z043-106438, partial [Arapaima gigas]
HAKSLFACRLWAGEHRQKLWCCSLAPLLLLAGGSCSFVPFLEASGRGEVLWSGAHVHKGCRETLPLCSKVKMKVKAALLLFSLPTCAVWKVSPQGMTARRNYSSLQTNSWVSLWSQQQKPQFTVPDCAAVAPVVMR